MRTALIKLVAVLGTVCLAASCTTVYDPQGRPTQMVTPEGAALGAVAAGLIGYALADDGGRRGHGYRNNHRSYGGYRGYGGGYGGGGYCR